MWFAKLAKSPSPNWFPDKQYRCTPPSPQKKKLLAFSFANFEMTRRTTEITTLTKKSYSPIFKISSWTMEEFLFLTCVCKVWHIEFITMHTWCQSQLGFHGKLIIFHLSFPLFSTYFNHNIHFHLNLIISTVHQVLTIVLSIQFDNSLDTRNVSSTEFDLWRKQPQAIMFHYQCIKIPGCNSCWEALVCFPHFQRFVSWKWRGPVVHMFWEQIFYTVLFPWEELVFLFLFLNKTVSWIYGFLDINTDLLVNEQTFSQQCLPEHWLHVYNMMTGNTWMVRSEEQTDR